MPRVAVEPHLVDTLPMPPPTAPGADEARASVHLGLWVSAARCLLTYVLAPLLGGLGLLLGPIGLALQVLGTITAVSGARRLHALHHPARLPYAFVAAALLLTTALALVDLLR